MPHQTPEINQPPHAPASRLTLLELSNKQLTNKHTHFQLKVAIKYCAPVVLHCAITENAALISPFFGSGAYITTTHISTRPSSQTTACSFIPNHI